MLSTAQFYKNEYNILINTSIYLKKDFSETNFSFQNQINICFVEDLAKQNCVDYKYNTIKKEIGL